MVVYPDQTGQHCLPFTIAKATFFCYHTIRILHGSEWDDQKQCLTSAAKLIVRRILILKSRAGNLENKIKQCPIFDANSLWISENVRQRKKPSLKPTKPAIFKMFPAILANLNYRYNDFLSSCEMRYTIEAMLFKSFKFQTFILKWTLFTRKCNMTD